MNNGKLGLIDVTLAIGFIILIITIILDKIYLRGVLEVIIGLLFITISVITKNNHTFKKKHITTLFNLLVGIALLVTGLENLCF